MPVEIAPRAGRSRRAGRRSSRPPTRRSPGRAPRGVPRASSSRLRPVDRRQRHARQGNDRGDDRLRPARDRARPGVADRRARAAARLERGLRARATSSSKPTSPTAPSSSCRRRSPSSRTSSSTTTPSSRRLPSSRPSSTAGSRGSRTSCGDAPPYDGRARGSGRAQPPERRGGARRARACRRLARRGRRRRSRASREPAAASRCTSGGVTIVDDYGHHPTEIAARSRRRASAFPGARLRVLFQPHLYSRTRHLAAELAEALAAADDVTVTDIYPGARAAGRRRDREARRRRAQRPRRARRVHADRRGRAPSASRGGRGRATSLLVARRGRRRPRRRRCSERLERGTRGGERPARALHDDRHRRAGPLVRAARAARRARRSCSRWARRARRGGRDDRARLEPARARRRRRGARAQARRRARRGRASRATCSSRAAARRTPSACTAPATPGSAGFEFASAIPGTAGGGVRMNAGAYGRDWRDVLIDAVVVDADGVAHARRRSSSSSRYRHSALAAGRGRRAGRASGSSRSSAEAVKARVAELLAQRKATQPTNKRTFGSVFKNPDGERGAGRMIEECGLKGHRIGGALISPRHANFIENAGGATSRRRARADGGGAPARARASSASCSSTRCGSSARSSCRPL